MNWKFLNKAKTGQRPVIEQIMGFEERSQKSMVHVRLDKDTALLLKQLKLVTGVEMQQVIAFAGQ